MLKDVNSKELKIGQPVFVLSVGKNDVDQLKDGLPIITEVLGKSIILSSGLVVFQKYPNSLIPVAIYFGE